MLKNWLLYLLGLAGALVFHIYYFGWYSWFVLVLALALPWFSLVTSLLPMLRTRVFSDAPASLSRGEAAYVTLRAGNGFLPQPCCRFRLTITAVMTGERRSLRQKTQSQGSWYVPLDTSHCGAYISRVEKARVYDYLGLPADVIFLLVGHCAERVRRRYGEGRRPGMKQIEKEGYAWARMGIDSQEAAAAYLRTYARRQEDLPRYMRALGLGDRAPAPSEEKYSSPVGRKAGNTSLPGVLMSAPKFSTGPSPCSPVRGARQRSSPPYPPGMSEAK